MMLHPEETVHFELDEDMEMEVDYPERSKYGWAYNRIPLTRKQWIYLLLIQGIGSAFVNFFINLFITYIIFDKTEDAEIQFTGSLTCIFSDIMMTCFLLPFITNLLSSIMVTFDLRKGKWIQPIDERWLSHPVLRWIPTGINWKLVLKRSIIFGIFGVLIISPPTLLVVYLALKPYNDRMQIKWTFYLFKGFWTALMALFVSPFIAFILVASHNPRNTFFSNSSSSKH
ncbi:hypothetical protein DFA_06304 [Cavenderia fasciculata]|uniref:Transmembrane protein n=1 Tax=Cavenderia fasciculata TaxID=261658 RepID=F4PKN4_CACFS|nr:uncharacterized protein DFA_06304 [Cavenderia fasciculata]EGG24158.1 hypothetical protein DFA_06304 [Cavenderia fasciculata]|eukprot:XP_004362009.1 hypothetical protein DFA_06304 [Cavenderia fasciculata]